LEFYCTTVPKTSIKFFYLLFVEHPQVWTIFWQCHCYMFREELFTTFEHKWKKYH